MKFVTTTFVFASIPLLIVSCVAPTSGQGGSGAQAGTFQDPNNPYAVPGVTTQGGGYAPAAQAPYQAPAANAPYQSIPSAAVNPPANIPSYTPPAVTSSPASSGGSSHTVGAGDTLWGLSRKYGVSVDQIRQANSLTSDTIVTGQSLSIPN